jgi:hypothetical protein
MAIVADLQPITHISTLHHHRRTSTDYTNPSFASILLQYPSTDIAAVDTRANTHTAPDKADTTSTSTSSVTAAPLPQ